LVNSTVQPHISRTALLSRLQPPRRHLLRAAPRHHAALQARTLARLHPLVQLGRLGVAQVLPERLLVAGDHDGGVRLRPGDVVDLVEVVAAQHVQVEEAQVGRPQGAARQRLAGGGEGGVALLGRLELQLEHAGAQLEQGHALDAGVAVVVPRAGPEFGQSGGQEELSGVEQVNAVEAAQQANGGGRSGEGDAEGGLEQIQEEVAGLFGEALAEPGAGNGRAGGGHEAGELLGGGVGVLRPGEDQTLGEGLRVDLPPALDQAGLLRGRLGAVAEELLQEGNQACYAGLHGVLLKRMALANTTLAQEHPYLDPHWGKEQEVS
jgi:hypothetical protein